jgi:hypothetical protein
MGKWVNQEYVVNGRTGVIHHPDCGAVRLIDPARLIDTRHAHSVQARTHGADAWRKRRFCRRCTG